MNWAATPDKAVASAALENRPRDEDVIAQQQALIFQIQTLRRTRDAPPPRLVSGQGTL